MRKGKVAVLLLCLIFCLSVVYSAGAESPLSAKQLLLNKLESLELEPTGELYKTFSGTATYTIKELSGMLISSVEPLKNLTGAQFKLDYGFLVPQNKLEANYDIIINQGQYKGDIYLDATRLILSSDVLSLVKLFNPEFNTEESGTLTDYLYLSDPEITNIWNNMDVSSGQKIPPEFKELLVFFVEAVPDQYFTTSLVNQKVTFSLDQDGLEDVLLAILIKVKNEDERFAELAAGLLTTYSPGENKAAMQKKILDGLEESIQDGSFPDSADDFQELGEVIVLNQLSCEIPLLPGGQSNFTMDFGFGGDAALTGGIKVDVVTSGPADNNSGTYAIDFEVQESKQKIKANGQVSGDFRQTGKDGESNVTIRVQARDFSETTTFLNMLLEGQSDVKVDQSLQINIPVLTESNSMNLEKYLKKPSGVSVLVDGRPVYFDVAPFIKDDRTIVPLRNLAETLGCAVTWTEPDRIDLNREDISITIYIENPMYTANGTEKMLDACPFIKDERTMVPLRFIAEEFGCRVQYEEVTQTVYINTQ